MLLEQENRSFWHVAKRIAPKCSRWAYRVLTGRGRKIHFGDLHRPSPISANFGLDRGTAIDRYYIELFLRAHRFDIHGRVLEVGSNFYSLHFGGSQVTHSDILHVDSSNKSATIVGDLAQQDTLPSETFDCIVLTQTLHLIFDIRAAIANLTNALAPGGVLLITVPGISQNLGEWRATWYWSLTAKALWRLLEEKFPHEDIAVQTHGNVYAATAFLYGLAVEDVDKDILQVIDASYPVTVAGRAVKPKTK